MLAAALLFCCLALPDAPTQNNVKVPQEIQSFITGATFSTLVSE
jgi:hypothetical protein